MNRTTLIPAAALAAVLALAGCGDDDAGATDETRTAANGDEFNDADVAFATDMIPHHAQALAMVDLTQGRELDPEVQRLTEDIRAAQAPEIEQMVDWLTAWDEPVPETMRDHANSHDMGEGDGHDMEEMDDGDMPGMMSDEEMTELEDAPDADFQTMWLEMMIDHHEGAVEMARTEQEDGVFEPATELAESIETSQEKEIALMEGLLGS